MSRRVAEIAFALMLAAVGTVFIYGARQLDTGWGSSGPEAGFFPQLIGIVIVVASVLVLASQMLRAGPRETFIDTAQARGIAAFLLPLVALVVLTPWLGLYLAAAIYLLATIGGIGRAGWVQASAVAVSVPVFMFVLFEHAFKTPLPKGVLEPLIALARRAAS